MSDPRVRGQMIQAVMVAIHDLIPLDHGSTWAPTFSPRWPKDYTRSEVELRRAVATAAVLAIEQHSEAPTPERKTP